MQKTTFDRCIEFRDVHFRYPDGEKEAIQGFSLSVPKGKTIAIVGQSGSGKSTLTNLICPFYDVTGGSIAIDGHDIRDIRLSDLRGLCGLVTQESLLFNDTIRNNLLLGKTDATDQEILQAAQVANAMEFIERPSRGVRHEHRRCRPAALRRTAPTPVHSSGSTQECAHPALGRGDLGLGHRKRKTGAECLGKPHERTHEFCVAHRLSTIQNADLIVVMSQGRIIEQGTHEQLLALGGMYAKLIHMQSFEN